MSIVTEYVSGNIFIRPMLNAAAKGAVIEGHEHSFDHTTFIVSGKVRCNRMWPDGQIDTVDKKAGEHVLIEASCRHGFEALENNTTVICIYSHRVPNGEVVQEYTGWSPAYG